MADLFGQASYAVRFGWGPADAVAVGAEVAVVVDVLSFSTCVTVAVERGTEVMPYRWRDGSARAYADDHDAVLAVGRSHSRPSLSPAALLRCEPVPRLVLPSPNGSTICAVLAERGAVVAIGGLRNARAAGEWLAREAGAGRAVVVIAAGERWETDDSLRPALEDQLGAGAVLSSLLAVAPGADLSPEARAAVALFDALRPDLPSVLRDCVSGRELTDRGFADDVDVAADLDATGVVPVLRNGRFGAGHRAAAP